MSSRRAYDAAEHARVKQPVEELGFGPLFDTAVQDQEARDLKRESLAEGRARRDAALDLHEQPEATARALEYVRGKLVELYEERRHLRRQEDAYVTADDADDIIRTWTDCPPDVLSLPSQNWRGSVFRSKRWMKLGRSVESSRPHMHATSLPCWAVREEARS